MDAYVVLAPTRAMATDDLRSVHAAGYTQRTNVAASFNMRWRPLAPMPEHTELVTVDWSTV